MRDTDAFSLPFLFSSVPTTKKCSFKRLGVVPYSDCHPRWKGMLERGGEEPLWVMEVSEGRRSVGNRNKCNSWFRESEFWL